MSSIIRWDPFREMLSLRREMDRLFDDRFFSPESRIVAMSFCEPRS